MQTHVVVDGSNIATEGRAKPSLAQLNEAVTTFLKEHPGTVITVVVDATFGYRIDRKEQVEFEQAIESNEIVTPPAGAVGRGDAFVLGIADKVDASVLSNDSYQEFHGQYPWLFTEGRLIGGKPVPNVGWVFVERLPVRGQTSRRAMKANGKMVAKEQRRTSPAAFAPLPVPKTPPPRMSTSKKGDNGGRHHANELGVFLDFAEAHPVGTAVQAKVEAYSAHGATVTIGDVRGYVPLHLLASPAPRSAREHLRIGQNATLVVAGYTPARRSIELGVAELVLGEDGARRTSARKASARKTTARKSTASKSTARKTTASKSTARKSTASKTTASKSTAKKSAVRSAKVPAKKPAPASTRKRTTTKVTARRSDSVSSARRTRSSPPTGRSSNSKKNSTKRARSNRS